MNRLHLLAWFFGACFLTNAIPHFVSGVMGKAFQSPFASPPGQGLSPPTINVLWGFLNAVVAYLLLVRVGTFDAHNTLHIIVFGAGVLVMACGTARHFGRFNSGLPPSE
jgi:hypothetical protein